jgi:hypothetical protein
MHPPGPIVYVISTNVSVTGAVTMYSIRHSSPPFPAKPMGAPSDHAS